MEGEASSAPPKDPSSEVQIGSIMVSLHEIGGEGLGDVRKKTMRGKLTSVFT